MSRSPVVAIAGAGIGGLSTAIALRRRGMHVEVFEQAGALGEVGAGVAISTNGTLLLQRAGMFEDFTAVASAFWAGSHYVRADGTGGLDMRRPRSDPAKVGYGIYRPDLIDVLQAHLPDGCIHTGHRLKTFDQDESGVDLVFENGATFHADALIGADGIHSVIRPRIVEEKAPVSSNMAVYRTVIPTVAGDRAELGESKLWMGDGKHLLAYPLRRGELMNLAAFVPTTVDAKESWSAQGSLDEFAAEFAGWDPVVEGFIARAERVSLWGLFDRDPIDKWVIGRVALLGDAAHAMLPHHGQGANQTIEDAFTLAAALEGRTAATLPEGLQRYESLRITRASTIQRMSRRNGQMLDVKSDASADLDRRDAELATALPAFREWLRNHDADSLEPAAPAPVY